MKYSIVEKKGFIIVGMKYYGNNSNNEIDELWKTFNQRIEEITTRVQINVVFGYDTWTKEIASTGKFTYYAAVAVSDDSCIPDGMEIIKIPANKYAVFELDKNVPDFDKAVKNVYREVMPKEGLKLNGNYDYEHTEDIENKNIILFHVPVE